MTSKHYKEERESREQIISTIIGYGKIVNSFRVDKGHPNGAEIHKISDTGIITIYNERTHKLITKLIARPNQIKRYYAYGKAPRNIVEKAYNNTVINGYNNF